MKTSVLIQSYKPRCMCGTRPGTPAWDQHIFDLFRLEEQALRSGIPDLIRAITALVEDHLAREG